jgi:hypothetical protein
MGEMRTVKRPRRYIHRRWLRLLRPILRYSEMRNAYVLRGVGSSIGPVLRADRRQRRRPHFEGPDRRVRRDAPAPFELRAGARGAGPTGG